MADILVLVVLLLLIAIVNYLSTNKDYVYKEEPKEDTELALYRYNKRQYLQSPEWSTKRKEALKLANYECQMCHSNEPLHVHHISYKNLFREPQSDLTALCQACHTVVHSHYGYPNSIKEYESFYAPPIRNS